MKKSFLSLVAIAALGVSALANDVYVKAGAGYVLSDNETMLGQKIDRDAGYTVNLAIGKDIADYSAELEYSYGAADYTNTATTFTAKAKTNTLFVNGYYNFMKDSEFSPYIGAGLGYTDYDDKVFDDTGVAYQGIIGTNYDVAEQTAIYAEYRYRYFDIKRADMSNSDASEFILGIKYSF